MAPKSIFRQPGARHFQLVHRSQRDPLINDPEASQHVLKPIIKVRLRFVVLFVPLCVFFGKQQLIWGIYPFCYCHLGKVKSGPRKKPCAI